jgi:hypothetical protein
VALDVRAAEVSPEEATQHNGGMAVVDVTTFRLTSDEQSFRAADGRMQTEFSYQQPGCLRRTTARGDDEWVVITLWATAGDAEAAAATADGHPVAAAFMACVDDESVRTNRYNMLE